MLKVAKGRMLVKFNNDGMMCFLGMDSESSEKIQDNLLLSPVEIHAYGEKIIQSEMKNEEGKYYIKHFGGDSIIESVIEEQDGKILWSMNYNGENELRELTIVVPFDPLYAVTALFSRCFKDGRELPPPWMFIVPDYGHAVIDIVSQYDWTAFIDGRRGGGLTNAPKSGLDTNLRGEKWIEASGRDYTRGVLALKIVCKERISSGEVAKIIIDVPELKNPEEIDKKVWMKIRRPYLNVWQPSSNWTNDKATMVLANNVLSDPASCSLWYYSEPMLFYHEPIEGFDMRRLLKHSLDFYINNYLGPVGNMIAFGKHDIYICTNAHFLVASWDYWKISNDTEWFEKNIEKLNLIADFLIRRDIDNDGIIESYGSGNTKMLRDPDRADVWWEMVNFNWKNTWTNAHAYRAFLCFAEILDACGKPDGACRYRMAAERIRKVYYELFYNHKTGWICSWISLDGKMHDYCYTPVNGIAIAYGLVPVEEGKKILSRIIEKMHEIGFCSFHLGVPLNLIPIHPDDRIQPQINSNGSNTLVEGHTESLKEAGPNGCNDFGKQVYNGSLSPCQTWHYILALQELGFDKEADMIINSMIDTASKGGFQNGIVNRGYGGAEHLRWDGKTCGYEGYLADEWVFLTTAFTRYKKFRDTLLGPLRNPIF